MLMALLYLIPNPNFMDAGKQDAGNSKFISAFANHL